MSNINWRLALVLGVTLFSLFSSNTVISTLIPVISKQSSFSPIESGAILSAFGYTYAAMQIPVGLLSDRYEPRKIITISTFSLFLATLLFSLSSNFVQMLFSRLLLGISGSFLFVDGLKTVEMHVEKEARGTVIGIFESFAYAGITTSNAIAEFFLQSMGSSWHIIYLTVSLGVLASSILCFFLLPSRVLRSADDKGRRRQSEALLEVTPADKTSSWNYRQRFLSVIKNKQFWIQVFISVVLFGSSFAVIYWIPTYFETKGFGLEYGSAAVALIGIGSIVGALVGGYMADKSTRRLPIIRASMISYAFLVFITVIVSTGREFWLVPLIGCLGIGVTQGGLIANTRMVAELFPRQWVGMPYGLYNSINWLASAIYPFTIGVIVNMGFSFSIAFLPIIASTLAIVTLTSAAVETSPKQT